MESTKVNPDNKALCLQGTILSCSNTMHLVQCVFIAAQQWNIIFIKSVHIKEIFCDNEIFFHFTSLKGKIPTWDRPEPICSCVKQCFLSEITFFE